MFWVSYRLLWRGWARSVEVNSYCISLPGGSRCTVALHRTDKDGWIQKCPYELRLSWKNLLTLQWRLSGLYPDGLEHRGVSCYFCLLMNHLANFSSGVETRGPDYGCDRFVHALAKVVNMTAARKTIQLAHSMFIRSRKWNTTSLSPHSVCL